MISIHSRLALSLLIGSAVLYGVGGWWLDLHFRETLEVQHDAALVSRAWALANALQADDGKIELEALNGITAALQASSRPLYFEVWHSDGRIAGRSPTLAGRDLPRIAAADDAARVIDVVLPPDDRAGRAAGIEMNLFEELEESDVRDPTLDDLRLPPIAGTPIDRLSIVVAEDLRDLTEAMQSLRGNVTAFAILSFALSALYLGWSLRRGLAPLTELADRARALEPHSLHVGIGRDALPRELVPVRDRMNELLGRVQSALEFEQRFTAGLAHELRTPVAELRLMAEVALRRDATSAERRLQNDVLTVSCRMQRLIESLLMLRRAETSVAEVEMEPVSLVEAVGDVVTEHASNALYRDVRCVVRGADDIVVRTNAALLDVIVGNIVSNAIEYCPSGSFVTADVSEQGEAVVLTLQNRAPGLSEQDVARMFEPFWRGNGAGGSAGHAGIGLSLAQSLARALHCDLVGELSADGELSMRLDGLKRWRE